MRTTSGDAATTTNRPFERATSGRERPCFRLHQIDGAGLTFVRVSIVRNGDAFPAYASRKYVGAAEYAIDEPCLLAESLPHSREEHAVYGAALMIGGRVKC